MLVIARWQFRRGFRAGFADALGKKRRELHAGSWFAKGYVLGVGAYAVGLPVEDALDASVRGVFEGEQFSR